MKPASFRYVAARDVDEAVSLLQEHGESAKLLAGGQSLVPMMNLRLARPEVLIDLNRIRGRGALAVEGEALRAPLLVRQRDAERSALVGRHLPVLREALSQIGHPQIRSRGTLVGSCCHADPSAEIPAVLLATGGSVRAQGPQGAREIPAEEFFLGYFTTALGPREVATDLLFPLPLEGTGSAFLEFSRHLGDFALVGVAALLGLGPCSQVEHAAIAIAGGGPAPVRAHGAEAVLLGRRPDPETLLEAARVASDEIDPSDDVHADGAYRTSLARTLVARTLSLAARRAQGEVA